MCVYHGLQWGGQRRARVASLLCQVASWNQTQFVRVWLSPLSLLTSRKFIFNVKCPSWSSVSLARLLPAGHVIASG